MAARTIADIYIEARWQIELFFKWIKQNLKIKSFLGTSRNAVITQSCIKFLNNIQPSLQQILRLLQINLFERRDLLELLRGDLPKPRISPNQTAHVILMPESFNVLVKEIRSLGIDIELESE